MAKPINCEDTSDEEGWSYCGKRECVSCGVGDEKKASNDRAFRTGWSVVKSKAPRFCPQCMGEEMEIDTKEDNLRDLAERTGSYSHVNDKETMRDEKKKIMTGPNYWGYCLDCDYEMEG